MKARILIIQFLFICSLSFSQGTNSCVVNNAVFELGTTTGWVCKSGYNGGGSCPVSGNWPRFPTVYTGGGIAGAVNAPLTSTARHTIVTGAGMDPNSNNTVPVVAPGGGTYSFRLGNDAVGSNAAPPGGPWADAEAIR